MPSSPSLTGITGLSPTATTQADKRTNGQLGKDDFLKLFTTQMQMQNPLSPMEDNEFMGQMASFSTLEQVSKLAEANEKLSQQLALSGSIGFIGRTVTYTDAAGESKTGVVERIGTQDGKQVLTVAGIDGIDPSKVTQVA